MSLGIEEDISFMPRFVMTDKEFNILSGIINPPSEDDRLKLKSQIEDMFIAVANSDDNVISLSKYADIEDDSEYFDNILKEMAEKYPTVEVINFFEPDFITSNFSFTSVIEFIHNSTPSHTLVLEPIHNSIPSQTPARSTYASRRLLRNKEE